MRKLALALGVLALAACGVKAPPRPPTGDPSVRPERSEAASKGDAPPPTANPPSSVRPERSEAESKGDAGTP